MTKTAARISDLVEQLDPDQQEALLRIAEAIARHPSFYDTMSEAQRRELDEAIAEDERGEVISQAELDAEIEELFARRGV